MLKLVIVVLQSCSNYLNSMILGLQIEKEMKNSLTSLMYSLICQGKMQNAVGDNTTQYKECLQI